MQPLIRAYGTVDKMINVILKNTLKIALPSSDAFNLGEELFLILNKIKEEEFRRLNLKEMQLEESKRKKQEDEKAYRATMRVRPIARPRVRPELLPYPHARDSGNRELIQYLEF